MVLRAKSEEPSIFGSVQVNPEAVFRKCVAAERQLLSEDFGQLRNQFISNLTFGPLLPSDLQLRVRPSPADPPELAAERDRRLGAEYRELLRYLKGAADKKEERWRVLAMWLKQEGLFEPEEFLPKDVFRNLTENVLRSLAGDRRETYRDIKPSQMLYANLVELWLPYFQLLREAYLGLRRQRISDIPSELTNRGFNLLATQIFTNPIRPARSPVSAAVRWVADRLNVEPHAVHSAHSLLFGAPRRRIQMKKFHTKAARNRRKSGPSRL